MDEPDYNIREFGDYWVRQRADGYMSATDMCNIGGKKYCDYARLKRTKEFLKALEVMMRLSEHELVHIIQDGSMKKQGTWIHPRIATNLAWWISSEFSVEACRWVDEWCSASDKNKEEYIKEINSLKPSRTNQRESELRDKYCKLLSADAEVRTGAGYIDLLTDNQLIEIKTAAKWMHGIGQLIC